MPRGTFPGRLIESFDEGFRFHVDYNSRGRTREPSRTPEVCNLVPRLPVATQVPVGLGLLAGLSFALQSLGRRTQQLLDLLQALLLRGELQNLLADLGLELHPACDGERQVPVRWLYLDPDRTFGRGFDDPLEQGYTLLGQRADVFLSLILEVFDLTHVVRLARKDVV